jgi:hypothetical protein
MSDCYATASTGLCFELNAVAKLSHDIATDFVSEKISVHLSIDYLLVTFVIIDLIHEKPVHVGVLLFGDKQLFLSVPISPSHV